MSRIGEQYTVPTCKDLKPNVGDEGWRGIDKITF